MSRVPLTLPPGVFRNGTEYQAKGRYFDANLVRWYGLMLGPIGGWRERAGSGSISGTARAALAWKDNEQDSWLGIGTDTGLYVSDRAGNVTDITPADFVEGRPDATGPGGYGGATYGSGAYGAPTADSSLIVDATEWTLDTWGEYLVGVSPDDNKIYQWELDTATPAAQVNNSPTCSALVVTQERFLFALGTTDPRTVAWCDKQDNTTWTPAATNEAGDFPLQTGGRLMCGKAVQGGTLLFTDQDVFLATYIGGTLVYSFDKKGDACGAISRQCVASYNMVAAWMGPDCQFWTYNGYVQPLACDVRDYIIRDINMLQASKVFAVTNAAFAEIEFYYCSAASNEIDRCVVWNYRDNYWNIGRPVRTCGVDKSGGFQHPLRIGADGTLYEHEVGFIYDGDEPYAETGPIELGSGDNVMSALYLIPDEATVGDVTASFSGRFEPDGTEYDLGTYTLAARTPVRFTARQVSVKYTGATNTNWRVGAPRLDLVQGGRR